MKYPIYQWNDDYSYIYIKTDKNSMYGIPTKLLTEEEKKEIYKQMDYGY